MESKRGISKIAIIIIVLLIIVLIAVGTVLAIWLIEKNNKPQPEIKLYEEYTEGEGFVDEESVSNKVMTPLANGLKEYRNDEVGVRFGYLDNMSLPEDEDTEDGMISTIKSTSKSTTIVFKIGKIDVSQSDIDHIQKQKESLTQELIKAETKEVEVEENGKMVKKIIVPEKVSDINTSYSLLNGQLAVKLSYTENGMTAERILTIKDKQVYSITYKANPDEYSYTEEDKVFNSFEFIDKIDEIEKSDLNTVTINDKEYSLPLKVPNIEGIVIDSKYSSQKIEPNYFSIVSLYELQSPKYSAYIYNAKASINQIGKGYITAISTDINRGGNIKIYKGVEIGTTYAKVKELLGSPAKQYYSDNDTTLTNIYQIEGTTIQLKFRNDDLSKPNDTSKVVSILLKVAI